MAHAVVVQEDRVDIVPEGADNNLPDTGGGGLTCVTISW